MCTCVNNDGEQFETWAPIRSPAWLLKQVTDLALPILEQGGQNSSALHNDSYCYSYSMFKLLFRLIILGLVGVGAYAVYDYSQVGLSTRPDMPAGAFSLSYKNGLRAILVDVPDERESRRYFGRPSDVPFFIEDAWSFCYPPTDQDQSDYKKNWPDTLERFDALCIVEVDGKTVVRGMITTVPKL